MLKVTMQRLLSFVDRPRWSLSLLIIASVLAGIAEGAAILIVVRVAVDVASDQVSSDFVPILTAPSAGAAVAIAATFAVMTMAAHFVIAQQSAAISGQVLTNARSRALRAFASASWPVQSQQRLGSLQETVSTLSLLTSTFAQVLATGASNLIMLLMFMIIALAVNPLGMVIVSLAGVAVFMLIRPLATRIKSASGEFTLADTDFAERTTNFAASAMELRSFGVSDAAREQLQRDLEDVSAKQRSVRFTSAMGTSLYRDVAVLLLVGSVGLLTLVDAAAVGSASAVVVLVVRALASAHAVNAAVHFAHERSATTALLVERIEALEGAHEPEGTLPLSSIESFEARSVGYTYPDGATVLQDVTLEVRKGEILGIAGPSGAGKSTLLQVLLRLRRPTSGVIEVNGQNYVFVSSQDWARMVAYVPQEPTLFEGSISDNISFFRDTDLNEVHAVAAMANIKREIDRLPNGFDTMLGPGGTGLSGGQKQRVALARAMIGSPELIILDEPSSALDGESEGLVQEAIRHLAQVAAVIIVTHRDSTLALCDRLVTLDSGRLIDSSLS